MERSKNRLFMAAASVVLILAAQSRCGGQTASSAPHGTQPSHSLRLYVFDCGILHVANTELFGFKKEELATTDMSVPCFLVVHAKGTLMWETGVVPDSAWKPTGDPVQQHLVLEDSEQRDVTMVKSLKAQLAEIGYAPSEITYLAFSHYHYDHTANANDFAGATWIVPQVEYDGMFAEKHPRAILPSTYSALRDSKKLILNSDEHDVFGDGTVVLKSAPGHTPGQVVLYLKLAKTGAVVLSGDLYHYPEELTMDRVPTIDFSQEQTRASRVVINAFLKKAGAQLWIEHDFVGNAKLKKSPNFYE